MLLGFRIGFNSLHAWASVNHLHFHAMYLSHHLFLDNHPASIHIKSHCYCLDKCAIDAFVFTVFSAVEKRVEVSIMLLSNLKLEVQMCNLNFLKGLTKTKGLYCGKVVGCFLIALFFEAKYLGLL